MIISDDDILYAENILLPPKKQFDAERRIFIKNLTSCDVVACPGSGKTTSLLAKLLILSRKIPFLDNQGICVLTHTNVAIDEIKDKLGTQANNFLGYPNFFGTIQSFVDRFLAIPAFFEMKKFRPDAPDDEYYFTQLEKMLPYGTRAYLERRQADTIESLKQIKFEFDVKLCTLTVDLTSLGLKRNTSDTFQNINKCCQKLFSEGVLTYGQMYQLAEAYLKRHPQICSLFCHRFCYLLIDEMQDTDEKQSKLLDCLFNNPDRCIIQRVGDPNQAIFSSTRNGTIWTPRKPILHFSNSMRFGDSIATLLDTVRADRQILLAGSKDIPSLAPKMILYSDDNIEDVLQAFWVLICKHNLHKSEDIKHKKFYAIGWRKEHETTGITHYWPSFQPKQNKSSYRNLYSYIYQAVTQANKKNALQSVVKSIWDGLAKLYNIASNEKRLTGNSLHKEIRASYPNEYLTFMQKLSSRLLSGLKSKNSDLIHRFIVNAVLTFVYYQELKLTKKGSEFLEAKELEISCPEEHNMCSFDDNLITISTIHGVKGQTHTATMLLETKYQRKHESEYLCDYLCGSYARSNSVHLQQCLRMAHVAMSRPTHLFAMACHQDRIQGNKTKLINAGWTIYSVDELIAQ